MKKLLTLFILLISISTAHSQWVKDSKIFIDFGPKVLIGPSIMSCNVAYDTTTGYKHKFNSHGLNYGAKFAIDFGQHVAVVGEFLLANNTQNFTIIGGEKQIKTKGYQIPLMLRHNNENFGYLEGGVVFSKTNLVTESYIDASHDFTNLYTTKQTGLVFGLGGYLFTVENFGVSAGLRFRYDLTNSINSDNTKVNSQLIFANDSQVDKVNNMSLMFVLEFNYDLGFAMARSACGQRRKVMFGSGRR